MKRKNIFVAIAIVFILVLSISSVHAALINPYENWIERKDLKNCTITFVIVGTYLGSGYGQVNWPDQHDMRFENGEFDSANNTLVFSSTTEKYRECGNIATRTTKKECQIKFDSGANNIKSFSAMVTDEHTNSYGDFHESETSIKGSGPYFPLIKKISLWAKPESEWVEYVDMKNTSYSLWWREQNRSRYVKDNDIVIREKWIKKFGEEYKTYTRELRSFEIHERLVFLKIFFNGYLPRLRDSKGLCSYFGGPDDTGIDVTLRQKFYEESKFEGEYSSKIFEKEEVSYAFNEWMNDTPKTQWEGTGLNCGYARELDTKKRLFLRYEMAR